MDRSNVNDINESPIDQISQFAQCAIGLDVQLKKPGFIEIVQKTDGKALSISHDSIEEVLSRLDSEGEPFLQVNFLDGKKMLLTEKLVGFKPAVCIGLDMEKLPKVVTTPDLISVVEAIEETMHSEEPCTDEVKVLQRVFDSVLEGGEAIGFNLSSERAWLKRLAATKLKPSA